MSKFKERLPAIMKAAVAALVAAIPVVLAGGPMWAALSTSSIVYYVTLDRPW